MRIILTSAIAVALSTTAVMAQDAAPSFNWNSTYIGVQAGAALSYPGFSGNVGPTTGNDFNDSGFVGGIYVGRDWQAGNIVYGGVLNFDYLGISPQYAEDVTFGGKTTITDSYGYDVDWVAAAQARAGYLVTDQFLVYGTGGVAVTRVQAGVGRTESGGIALRSLDVPGDVTASVSKTLVGGAIGGGVEYMFAPNMSVKAGYTHYMFGSVDVGNGIDTESVTFKPRFGTATIGLSYRF